VSVHVRVCVECGEEYRPEVATCADCGGRLEDRHDDQPLSRPRMATGGSVPAAADPDPLPGARPVAWSADARELVPWADQLSANGLDFRIAAREGPSASGFEIRVRDAEREAAVRALAPLVGPGSGASLLDVVVEDEHEAEELRCPACDTTLPAGATECPGCGLGLEGEPRD
jgi:hypothetical protein